MIKAILNKYLSDDFNRIVYEEAYEKVVSARIYPRPAKYNDVIFKTPAVGYADIRMYYVVLSPYGIDYFGYKDGKEIGVVGVDEQGTYSDIYVWLSTLDDIENIALEITLTITRIFRQMWEAGKDVDFAGLIIKGIYSLKVAVSLEDALDNIFRAMPWLSTRAVYRILKDEYRIKVNISEVNRRLREYRDMYSGTIEKYIRKRVRSYISSNPKIRKKQVMELLKAEEIYINDQIDKMISNLLIQESENRDAYVERIMRMIIRRNKPKSVNALIRLYRSSGYKGGEAYLRSIAKRLMGR